MATDIEPTGNTKPTSNDDDWKYDPEHNHWGRCIYDDDGHCEKAGEADDEGNYDDDDD